MADWPELDELKQVLDVTSDEWDGDDDDTRLTGVLQSAIAFVKQDVGAWDYDGDPDPTYGQSRAALRMAELMALRPDRSDGWASDPTYQRHLYGSRQRFAVG